MKPTNTRCPTAPHCNCDGSCMRERELAEEMRVMRSVMNRHREVLKALAEVEAKETKEID